MTTQEIIKNWLTDAESDLILNYQNLGLKASGLWANSLEQFQTETDQVIKLGIKGQKYTGAIEYGRRSNRNQTPEAIRRWAGWAGSTFIKQWCIDKGIPTAASYAIAYKIALQGWRVPNRYNAGGLVSKVITDERMQEIVNRLGLFYVGQLKTEMINTLEFGNNYETIK